ncbi:cysteine hydrolase family protein [Clavibacter capsici]|uniref:cysteine hydrolase family protein n=1 Tax=Clavibacter capsici TaxID=1874630 RepID=UPI00293E2FFF|nr:isochorismatase family cysteine hydrolase [Clavibacter capsici]
MTAIDVHGSPLEIARDGGFGPWLDPASTAVISIDMHQGHLSEDPDCPCPAPRGRQVIAPIDDFHRRARALGVPVIHVRSEVRASGIDDLGGTSPSAWRRTFPQHVGEIPGASDHAIAGSRWTEFATDVQPGDEVVTGKKRLSAFYPTDLDFLLRQMGVRAVVLDGIMADCCVLNTAFDASNLGYRVTVLSDLVRGTDEGLERAALGMVSLHLGLVTTADELVGTWQAARADVEEPAIAVG